MPQAKEVPRNVVNHEGRGDVRGIPTREDLTFQRDAEKKSTEELRAEAEKQLKTDRWQEVGAQVFERISAVLHQYPWYRDTMKNGQVIAAKLAAPEAIQERRRQHREDNDYTLLEIAGAVEEGLANGELEINEAAARRQRIEEYSEQLVSVSRADPETMPLHELRALADGRYDPLGPKG